MIAGRKLLLADDSVAIQKVIDLTFTDEGMEVTTVGDGDDALEKLNQLMPDVVLADVFMPGTDGYGLCKFIKENERFRGVPVMLLVGSFEPFDEAEAKRAGADDVVTKPFQSIRDLVSRVGSLVDCEKPANQYSVLGLTQPEYQQAEADADVNEVEVSTEAASSEPEPANVKVFVEAPMMETTETVDVQDHTCPPDIELQTADTRQLEPIEITAEPEADTVEVEAIEETENLTTAESAGPLPSTAASELEAVGFDSEGVLDLGDVDNFAAEDDFELDVDVEPVASFSEAAALDNEPALQPMRESFGSTTTEQTSAEAPARTEPQTSYQASSEGLSPEAIEAISRRVVEQLSDKVVREIAWEVVPELSEMLIKKRLEEQK